MSFNYISITDRSGKVPTEKQLKARNRNWYIRKLRAYYHLCPIRGSVGKDIKNLIDKELISLGAESESVRESNRLKKLLESVER